MTTHLEPIDRNHPAIESLAREVLEREERLSAYTYSIPLAAQASWDATRSEQVRSAPELAHAVIELTATVKRVEALADKLEREAEKEREKPNRGPHDYGWDDACTVAAHRIRAALNGDDQ